MVGKLTGTSLLLLAAVSQSSSVWGQASNAVPVIVEATFGTVPVPSRIRPIALRSKIDQFRPERVIIFLRGPCQNPHDYSSSERVVGWKQSSGVYLHFSWCGNGEPYNVESMNGLAPITEAMQRLKSGFLVDTEGHEFSFPQFPTAARFNVEYWTMTKLRDSWWGRPATLSPAAGGPASEQIAGALAKEWRSVHYIVAQKVSWSTSEYRTVIPILGHVSSTSIAVVASPAAKCVPSGRAQYDCRYTVMITDRPTDAGVSLGLRATQNKWVGHDTFQLIAGDWGSSTARGRYSAQEAEQNRTAALNRSSSSADSSFTPTYGIGGIPDINGTMCELGSKSYC